MRQYRAVKEQYPDGIVFFQVGDFYETFYDDAKEVSRLLNIALTSRDKGKEDPIPLAGVPVHAAQNYITKLLQQGRKVVVCDQVESPAEAKGIVKRSVTDIVTPGTTLEPASLVDREHNFLLSILCRGDRCGFALLDVSTGEFKAGEEDATVAESMLTGFTVREAILPHGDRESVDLLARALGSPPPCNELEQHRFGARLGRETLAAHFGVENLSGFALEERSLATSAAGSLLGWVKELRRGEMEHITGIGLLVPDDILFLDRETMDNLELFRPSRYNTPDTSLIHLLDRTGTPAGARLLRSWLRGPSRRIDEINRRLDGIETFTKDHLLLSEARERLRGWPDVERLLSRIATSKAGPRELLSLAEAIERLPGIGETVAGVQARIVADAAAVLSDDVRSGGLVRGAIEPGSPPHLREGGVIRKGFDERLDRLIGDAEEGRKWIASLQETERRRTGIPSLKVGYNRVFGYYIEISRTHDDKVPVDYICKQTLVSSQRYVTNELKEREQVILAADSKRVELEREIFASICRRIAEESDAIRRAAQAVAVLDVITTLASVAVEHDYSRPEVNESRDLVIVGGRHPVVEVVAEKGFIPNDLTLRPDEKQVVILTGPNMGGKSTYIRQTAIIAIMAHMGGFVPATKAVVGLVDRIFTRVGSSDNLARGQSTFLVEMSETAKILHNCSDRSLVILDEVGRGTSTMDGLSIAWAVTEFLLEEPGRRAKTLFATHFHELTHLAEKHARVQNMQVDVKEWGNTIVFLYKIRHGACDKSYGIHVAQLAGLPERITSRASQILESMERDTATAASFDRDPMARQVSLFEPRDPVHERLAEIDVDKTTPMEALRMIQDLKSLSDKSE